MDANKLNDLARRVRAASAEAKAPPSEGESKSLMFTSDLLGEDGWSLVWNVVRAIREHDVKTFIRFSELTLALRIVDLLEVEQDVHLPGLVARLKAQAEEFGPRIVSTAISNVEMNKPAIRLGDDAVLVRADMDRNADESDEDALVRLRLPQWLGAPMSRPLRFVDLRERFDTGRTAALLTVEQGEVPLARARARAQYAIAMWTVLRPPEGKRVLPDLGVWMPQPTMHVSQRHRALTGSDDQPSHVEAGGGFNDHRMFVLPEEEDLRLPLTAMEHLDRRGAQPVLSASLLLLAAGRASSLQSGHARSCRRSRPSARPHPPGRHASGSCVSHGVTAPTRQPRREGGRPTGSSSLWSACARRGTSRPMAPTSDLPILVHVVGRTLDLTIRKLASDDWSDEAYSSYFATG